MSPQENPNEPKQSQESKKLFLCHICLFFSSELYNVCREVVDNHDIIMEQGELVNEPKPVDDHPWSESICLKLLMFILMTIGQGVTVQLTCYNTAGIVSLDSADAFLGHQTRLANRILKRKEKRRPTKKRAELVCTFALNPQNRLPIHR